MNFLESIFEQLQTAQDTPLLRRKRQRGTVEATGKKLAGIDRPGACLPGE